MRLVDGVPLGEASISAGLEITPARLEQLCAEHEAVHDLIEALQALQKEQEAAAREAEAGLSASEKRAAERERKRQNDEALLVEHCKIQKGTLGGDAKCNKNDFQETLKEAQVEEVLNLFGGGGSSGSTTASSGQNEEELLEDLDFGFDEEEMAGSQTEPGRTSTESSAPMTRDKKLEAIMNTEGLLKEEYDADGEEQDTKIAAVRQARKRLEAPGEPP